ncbi:acyltransferase family protein [Oerskovia sp. M15]
MLSLLGLALIVGSAFAFGTSTPFPGWTALVPAVGTALVIVAGMRRTPLLHDSVTARRPVQLLGDISYSVYLWHWPLIVLAPFALARPTGWVEKVGLLVLSLLLAWLTKIAVEDRARTWTWASGRRGGRSSLCLSGCSWWAGSPGACTRSRAVLRRRPLPSLSRMRTSSPTARARSPCGLAPDARIRLVPHRASSWER